MLELLKLIKRSVTLSRESNRTMGKFGNVVAEAEAGASNEQVLAMIDALDEEVRTNISKLDEAYGVIDAESARKGLEEIKEF